LLPCSGPWGLAVALLGPRAPWRLRAWLGCWPAFVLFLAFAWFELVDPAPDDPARLATAAGLYWLLSFAAMLAFGYRPWCRQGEFLTLFLAMVARFGVVERRGGRLGLCLPGAKLLGAAPLPAS